MASYSFEYAGKKVPVGPANPGIIRNRDRDAFLRLPPDSDVFDTLANLRRDGNMSEEEAFLKLMDTYDVPIPTLSLISGNLLCSIVNVFVQLHC